MEISSTGIVIQIFECIFFYLLAFVDDRHGYATFYREQNWLIRKHSFVGKNNEMFSLKETGQLTL
jgi:hypothetical protein